MAIVRVIARAEARDGKAKELKALLSKMVMPTRLETGCRYYELFQSDKPGVFFFNELWNSDADLKAHTKSAHFIEQFGKAKDLMKSPLEVHFLSEVE
jgi:quinol monooxygenase YgiN